MSGIVDLSEAEAPDEQTVDVCVVGSGSGGATTARILAEAGLEVLVLEEGGDFVGTRLTQRDGEMYDQLYMDRGGRATEDLSISVLQGRVLGGGGVINASDVVPIPEGVLRHWARAHGLGHLSAEALAPHQQRVLADLSASRIAEDQLNLANRLLRGGAESLGWRGEVMMHNRVGCGGLGTCLIGCPLGAKQNPRAVAIPAAIQAGATFYTRARAVRIEEADRELKTVVVRTLDERGYHERSELRIQARVVVVAANAVATPQLLLRSGIGNEHVGRHVMLQPQQPIVALFDHEVVAFRGIPQAFAVTEFEREDDPEHGLWGFRIEAVMGTPGIVATLLPFVGAENKAMMTEYPRIAASLLLVPDAPSGTVGLKGSGRPLVQYTLREDLRQRLRQAVRAAARAYLAAGASEVLVPVAPAIRIRSQADLRQVDDLSFAPATTGLLSAHQQGGARMAGSAADGAVDPEGMVWGTRDVYVFDTSVFPSSSSSHTMAPVMTVSSYLATGLAERYSRG